ncbi:MAG: hypothetical protein QXS02_04165 [Candidatus Thermoplasmatota archaeon]
MAVPMNSPCCEDESIRGIEDDDDFEGVTFSDSSSNAFDIGEARLGLYQPSTIYGGIRPGFDHHG